MAGNGSNDRWSLADPDIGEKIARWQARPPALPIVNPVARVAVRSCPTAWCSCAGVITALSGRIGPVSRPRWAS